MAAAKGTGDHTVLPGMTTRVLLGKRLRALREARGVTLVDVAGATGLSRTFISMLEKGTTEVAVARLMSLTNYYGVTLSDVIGEDDPAVEYVPAELARAVPTEGDQSLAFLARRSMSPMQPYRLELPAGESLDGLAHDGDEWVTCVRGRCTLSVGASLMDLREGDTAFFPARLSHTYVNPTDAPTVLIGCTLTMPG